MMRGLLSPARGNATIKATLLLRINPAHSSEAAKTASRKMNFESRLNAWGCTFGSGCAAVSRLERMTMAEPNKSKIVETM